jgi:hypothetical protein
VQTLREGLPHLVVNALGLGKLRDRLFHVGAKLFAAQLRARRADDGKLGGHESLLHEAVKRGHEFALR